MDNIEGGLILTTAVSLIWLVVFYFDKKIARARLGELAAIVDGYRKLSDTLTQQPPIILAHVERLTHENTALRDRILQLENIIRETDEDDDEFAEDYPALQPRDSVEIVFRDYPQRWHNSEQLFAEVDQRAAKLNGTNPKPKSDGRRKIKID